MAFEQRPKYTAVWGKVFQVKGTAHAKALRLERAWTAEIGVAVVYGQGGTSGKKWSQRGHGVGQSDHVGLFRPTV